LTVVVGFVGDECAVMASDSEATESGHTRFDEDKIWTHGESLLMGYSGSGAVREALAASIATKMDATFGNAKKVERQQARTHLASAVKPVLTQFYSEFVSTTQVAENALGGTLLVIGRDEDGHWLLEIDHNNTTTFYEERGYQAIGSGGSAAFVAQGLLQHYQPREQTIEELRLIAYRTVKTCIDGLGGRLGVGGETHVWSCAGDGTYEKAGADSMASLGEGLTKWTTIERESLSQVWGTTPTEDVGAGGMPGPLEADEEAGDG
jgi:20S proteasome alpha/beta subunit